MNDIQMRRAPTFDELQREVTPQVNPGGNLETFWHDIYDTALYVSGTTTQLTFFSATRATNQLSNLSPAGQFPVPQFFELWNSYLDVIVPPSADGLQQQIFTDIHRLIYGTATGEGAPSWTFTLANKTYGPWPVSRLHASGGPQGFGYSTGTTVGESYANNSYPDGGWCWHGMVTIPPQQAFQVTLNWDAAQTLAADVRLRFGFRGKLSRRIL